MPGTTALLFPGQGAQFVGMGRELAGRFPVARQLFDRASELLGYDLARFCFEGPVEDLNTTAISQPALYVTSYAALEWLRHERPEVIEQVGATAGLSLGEYTALTFAEALDFETGLKLVNLRGQAMQDAADASEGAMVSILGLELPAVEDLCEQAAEGDILQPANLLCPGNIVISGGKAACARAATMAEGAGAMKAIPLAVAGAFHTPLMQSAVDRLTAALAEAAIHPPKLPVVSNVDAAVHSDPDEIRQLLTAQVCSPVRWHDSILWMLEQGFDQFYEVGPGRVLRGLMKRISRKTPCDGVEGL